MIKVEIPKEGVRLYAMIKAHELKNDIELKTDEQAINYLKSIGIEIINTKDKIIAELKAEIKELCKIYEQKIKDYVELKAEKNKYYQQTLDDEIQINELYQEIERLKEEVETRDNLSETFRKEALSCANIANEYQKDKTKLEQTLQEIKTIAESPRECILSEVSCCNICERLDKISHIITKAEEE